LLCLLAHEEAVTEKGERLARLADRDRLPVEEKTARVGLEAVANMLEGEGFALGHLELEMCPGHELAHVTEKRLGSGC
jgi:hypothetical protein